MAVEESSDSLKGGFCTQPDLAPVPARKSVFLLRGKDATHSPARIGDITFAPWDQMHMHMKDGLTGIRADIHTDVEAGGRLILSQDVRALLVQHAVDRIQFGLVKVEIVGDMALWDDKRMQRRDRKPVADHVAKLVFRNETLRSDFTENVAR